MFIPVIKKERLSILLKFIYPFYFLEKKIHTSGIFSIALKLLLHIRPHNTLYDTDDADYLRYKSKNIDFFIKNCEYCTVGSKALKDYVLDKNKKVFILTTPVIKHNEIKISKNRIFHIGWVGNLGQNNRYTAPFSHKISLFKFIIPILNDVDFLFKFTILGVINPDDKKEIQNYFRNKKNIILEIPEHIDWLDEIGIYKKIKEFDIGLSPLVNHDFNIAKSAFKAKQYLSCGVPVLGSPVGENKVFIKTGYNGYFCQSEFDFKTKIIEFYKMKKKHYEKFSDNAVKSTEEFNIERYCDDFIECFSKS